MISPMRLARSGATLARWTTALVKRRPRQANTKHENTATDDGDETACTRLVGCFTCVDSSLSHEKLDHGAERDRSEFTRIEPVVTLIAAWSAIKESGVGDPLLHRASLTAFCRSRLCPAIPFPLQSKMRTPCEDVAGGRSPMA